MKAGGRDLEQWLEEVRGEYWHRLASAVAESAPGLPCVLFRIGLDSFAVEARLCKGVVCRARVARLPATPAWVLGVCGIRGEVISATDPRALLGLPASAGSTDGHFLILAAERLRAALWVDRVDEVADLDLSRVLGGEGVFPAAPPGVIQGTWTDGGRKAYLLDGRRYLEATAVRR